MYIIFRFCMKNHPLKRPPCSIWTQHVHYFVIFINYYLIVCIVRVIAADLSFWKMLLLLLAIAVGFPAIGGYNYTVKFIDVPVSMCTCRWLKTLSFQKSQNMLLTIVKKCFPKISDISLRHMIDRSMYWKKNNILKP